MAVKPVDRIRTMITDLERGARTLGDDIRKRAGNVAVTSDLEAALRQLMQGLTTIAAQLEKAAGELRRYLEKGSKGKRSRKAGGKKAAKKTSRKKSTKKAAAKKAAPTKAASAKGAPAKAASKKAAKANGKKAASRR